MDVGTALLEFVNAIMKSSEFKELKKAKGDINRNSQAAGALQQFTKKQEAAYNNQLGETGMEVLIEELNKDYRLLSNMPGMSRYFAAVERFNKYIDNLEKAMHAEIERNLQD